MNVLIFSANISLTITVYIHTEVCLAYALPNCFVIHFMLDSDMVEIITKRIKYLNVTGKYGLRANVRNFIYIY